MMGLIVAGLVIRVLWFSVGSGALGVLDGLEMTSLILGVVG